MKRMTWTAIGAAGLVTGATIGGFAVVNASAADRAIRPVELQDVVNVTTGEPRGQLADGSVDSATGLPKPIVTINPGPAAAPTAMPTDSLDSAASSSAAVVAKPANDAAKAKATAKPKSTVTARPAAADSADSSASGM